MPRLFVNDKDFRYVAGNPMHPGTWRRIHKHIPLMLKAKYTALIVILRKGMKSDRGADETKIFDWFKGLRGNRLYNANQQGYLRKATLLVVDHHANVRVGQFDDDQKAMHQANLNNPYAVTGDEGDRARDW